MGSSLLRYDRFVLQAFVASLALHLVIAWLIPALASLRGTRPSIETLSFLRVTHISVETPRPVTHPPPARAPHYAPVPHVVKAQPARPRVPSVKHVRSVRSMQKNTSRAPLIASSQAHGSMPVQTTATGAPAAPATPQQEQIASTQSRHDTGGYLPFGVQQPDPVLDPGVLKALGALSVHVTLTVVVDEEGHTKSVAFNPPLDRRTEDQIRSMLADASWDPAVCGGGVACEGRTTIKL